jgi:hypothetical protein
LNVVDYVLKRDAEGMVRYLYRNDGKHPYMGKTKIESAEWMLRQGEVRVSEEYDGFPVTANGMYFFEAEIKGRGDEGEATSSATDGAPSPKGESFGVAIEIGADGLPMPAGAEKPRRKKRDERPTVREALADRPAGRTEGASADSEAARRARNSPPSGATGARRLKDVVCE